jgi:hypothetical protein
VLTFGVWRPSVFARLASRIHLRPLHLAVWTLASSARPPSGRFPFPRSFRPWSCSHPRGPRPLPCPLLRCDPRTASPSRTSSPEVRRPSNAPNPESPLPGVRHPDRPLPSCPSCERLVAGFHPRFGPPSPFPTTLTVCASPSPVVCFDHSRSWGFRSPVPHPNEFRWGTGTRRIGFPARAPGPFGPTRSTLRWPATSLTSRRLAAPSVVRGPKTLSYRRSGSRRPSCEGVLPLRQRPRCSR